LHPLAASGRIGTAFQCVNKLSDFQIVFLLFFVDKYKHSLSN